MKETGIKRLYYSISEVSRLADEEPYVLRYWETEFEQLRPQKNRAGNRVYNPKDIDIIKAIKYLLREKRYTIEGAKEIMRNYRPEMSIAELSGDVLPAEVDEAASHDTSSRVSLTGELAPLTPDAAHTLEQPLSTPFDTSLGTSRSTPQTTAQQTSVAVESLNGALAKPSLSHDDLLELRDALKELLRLLS
jgi:DNA-binding transcriptional MerR regulator